METPKTTKHESRSCLQKVKYIKKTAKQTAKAMRRRFREPNIKAYLCKYCPYWHVGHVKTDK